MSKMVQTKDREVFLVGGDDKSPVLANAYDVGRSCLKVDLFDAIITEKSYMATSRRD